MAKFNNYKLVADFNIWSQNHDPDKLYCVTTEEGEELFDVYEDDFISMIDKGLVNSDGCYYLLNNPTQDQINRYAKEYGILWTDKEKPEMTKHQIANDYVAKATRALVDAIKEDIIEIGKKRITIHTLAYEYGENIEEDWKMTRKGNEITFSNGGEKYSIEDLSISTLIDISNALLSDNYE